jgi:hypothetical protein
MFVKNYVYKEIASSIINQNIHIIIILFKETNSIEIVFMDISFQLLGVMLSTQGLEFFFKP